MSDDDSETRRMSEIADAINTILQNDTAEPETAPQATTDAAASEDVAANISSDVAPAAFGAEQSGDDLDAAIAAEFASQTPGNISDETSDETSDATGGATMPNASAAAADDPFGPPVTLDAPTDTGTDTGTDEQTASADSATDTPRDIGTGTLGMGVQKAHEDSDLSLLSLRMQETLSELQSGKDHGDGTRELLQDMKLVRAQVMADVRQEIENLAEATRTRQAMIHEEMRQLEAQSQMVRDAVEIQLIKFETALDELHQKYFKNAEAERIRMDRYREFLQFLLKEREF
jgi:hypothetical protein